MEDTICAVATSPGIGAISIIRVSGKDAIKIVNNIFKGDNLKEVASHTIHYGYIMDENEVVDEVLVSVMLKPKTYTTEDVIEINSHGGINTTNRILELLLEHGCRLAEPGEFTKRAFLNGRIDLTKAESINDLINAKSDQARMLALNNLKGALWEEVGKIRKKLVEVMSNIEVNIDYPEYEDIEVVTHENLLPKLNDIKNKLEEMLRNSKNGRIINEGIQVCLVGRPNTGKSSILNHLLGSEKAIVTNIAGTTRDIVEGSMNLNGYLINFIDTAGIRETEDKIEQIGVAKSKEAIKEADIVIVVLNNNEKLNKEDEEIINKIDPDKRIIFVNKSDLANKLKIEKDYVIGNTINIDGLDSLKKAIIDKLNLGNINIKDVTYISNIRQIDLLKKALNNVKDAIKNIEGLMPIDIVEIDINNAWQHLGEITGEVYQEELLDTLFSKFCVGK